MARFKIYSASAGSGKTYQLVKEYLLLSLANDNPRLFKKILAITFTNKAAAEMKERIIATLTTLARHKEEDETPSMMLELCEALNISHQSLSVRAAKTLSAILHQYSAFSVSTIDRFTNRLIRSFSRDLKVSSNYEVVLDNEEMLNEAVDQLLSQLEEKQPTTELILGFVKEQLEDGKSPHPQRNLLEAGKNLFKEDALVHLDHLKPYTPEYFVGLIKSLKTGRNKLVQQVKTFAEAVLEFLKAHDLDNPEYHSRGSLITYLKNLEKQETGVKWRPVDTLQKIIDGDNDFYAKSKKKLYGHLFAPHEASLRNQLQELVRFIEEHYEQIHLTEAVLRTIYGTAVITEINRQLQSVKDSTNRLPIGEFNKLIHEKLEDESADYLFERLGERYHFFFIDEFQDTSRLQWSNLLPLVNNALSAGGGALLVGDAKQSIYRFRGSEVSQFIRLKNDIDPSNQVLVNGKEVTLYERETFSLPKNYRSYQEVVNFNNSFFQSAAELINKPDFQELYATSAQEIQKPAGGYVELKMFPYSPPEKEHYQKQQCEYCTTLVKDALERGYSYRDICILVRTNGHGQLIAQSLLQEGIPLISPDALSLDSSREVNAIISGLQTVFQSDEPAFRYYFIDYLADNSVVIDSYPDKHEFIDHFTHLSSTELRQQLREIIPTFDLESFKAMSLLDLSYAICRCLDLDLQLNPYVHALLDQIANYTQRQGENLPGFLRWWEQHAEKLNVSFPDKMDAVQIMTIHKSKGLEFPICILAFADWTTETDRPGTKKWLHIGEVPYVDLPSVLLPIKKVDDELVYPPYQQLLETNQHLVSFDNINLLYVALTRAIQELYVLGRQSTRVENNRVFRYLRKFLDDHEADDYISFGSKVNSGLEVKVPDATFEGYESSQWQNKLAIIQDAPELWNGGELTNEIALGKRIHALLAEINHESDLINVFTAAQNSGSLTSDELTQLKPLVESVVQHPAMAYAYSADITPFNELDIIMPGGASVRPDKVVVRDSGTDIIDYKTGVPREAHKRQMESYRNILSEMGYPDGDNILVYIGSNIKIEKWQNN